MPTLGYKYNFAKNFQHPIKHRPLALGPQTLAATFNLQWVHEVPNIDYEKVKLPNLGKRTKITNRFGPWNIKKVEHLEFYANGFTNTIRGLRVYCARWETLRERTPFRYEPGKCRVVRWGIW